MLYLIDSNILLYAKMEAMPEHLPALTWLEETLAEPNSTVMLCETTILSFLRISTNSKVYDPPLPIAEAKDFLSKLLEHESVEVYRPMSDHYSMLTDFMEQHEFNGNLTMDAHLATLAIGMGATLVTRDSDFARVPFLKTVNPIVID